MPKWTPLTDIWSHAVAEMETANEEGKLDDPEKAESIIYPPKLYIGEGEKDDIRAFVQERMEELLMPIQVQKVFDPNHLATYIFRALICGMEWQKERTGF